MNTTNLIIFILVLFASKTLLGQSEDFTHSSSWNTITVKANLNEKLFLKTEFNFRRTNFLQDWEQIVLRPSIQYKLDDALTAAVGYTNIQNYSYAAFSTPINTRENNLWQQLFLKQDVKYFDISHRIRFEERFQEQVGSVDNLSAISGTDYSGRLRYRFIVTVPILIQQDISVVAYDEVFLDFEKGLQPKNLNQNWIFIGFRFRESEHITITSGYHNINISRDNFTITNHVWETSLIYTL
ncbi:DUF2490 domain-containing protein [Patiriisocius hiemis]|uniref:DUF2490 domain-containing protein n=1 Tax=Patiriisocius hiemis TaxID=3075604 RepID=A0ABU2YEL8_9FLAO|nr:DUF2490 domain-containing protein [Constantimarinum sp. W242]MDT0556187.1 DUF2490 domain-containing protein [Constantimarinum sp. W242]